MKSLGAQLYTVRDLLTTHEQTTDTLARIKSIGYTAVQLFGGKDDILRLAIASKENGLEIWGILSTLDTYLSMGKGIFEICAKYNIPDLGISSFYSEEEVVLEFTDKVNAFAAKAKEKGFSFSYHNHAKEFLKLPSGKRIMDHFLERFSADVDFMPDTYWVQAGGADVRHFLEKTSGRVTILHLKDMAYTLNGITFTEVGHGNLYMEGILRTARDLHIERFVVEQDLCDGDPLESLKISYDYLREA